MDSFIQQIVLNNSEVGFGDVAVNNRKMNRALYPGASHPLRSSFNDGGTAEASPLQAFLSQGHPGSASFINSLAHLEDKTFS